MPLTLCKIQAQDEYAVIEMGAAQLGDISHLTSLVDINTAAITNVSPAHIGRFGSFDNIVKEKGQIITSIGEQSFAVLPMDDEYFEFWKGNTVGKVMSFGKHLQADVNIASLKDIHLPIAGKHNLDNAACAKAIALSCNIDAQDIKKGLECFTPEAGRLENLGFINGVNIINDAYNANPNSVKAAIDVLTEISGAKTLVLGNMAELGDDSKKLHQQIGEYAQTNNITQLFCIGEQAQHACLSFTGGKCFDDIRDLKSHLLKNWSTLGTLLVKGSRSMRLENLINALIDSEKAA